MKNFKFGFTLAEVLITLACNKNANVSYPLHACTSLLYIDGFEFKDDYPW